MTNNQYAALNALRSAIDEIEKSAEMTHHDWHVMNPQDPISHDTALEETLDGGIVEVEDLPMMRPEDAASLLDLILKMSR